MYKDNKQFGFLMQAGISAFCPARAAKSYAIKLDQHGI